MMKLPSLCMNKKNKKRKNKLENRPLSKRTKKEIKDKVFSIYPEKDFPTPFGGTGYFLPWH